MSPLNAAAERGHADIVDVILRAGADVNLQVVVGGKLFFGVGMTPLCFAASNGHLDIVVMLLDAGADPNLANDVSGHKVPEPFLINVQFSTLNVFVRVHHAALGSRRSEYTALTYAALRGYPDIARVLLDRGAVNYRQSGVCSRAGLTCSWMTCSQNGDTPGSVATRFNHPEIAEMIASYFVPPPSSGKCSYSSPEFDRVCRLFVYGRPDPEPLGHFGSAVVNKVSIEAPFGCTYPCQSRLSCQKVVGGRKLAAQLSNAKYLEASQLVNVRTIPWHAPLTMLTLPTAWNGAAAAPAAAATTAAAAAAATAHSTTAANLAAPAAAFATVATIAAVPAAITTAMAAASAATVHATSCRLGVMA
eukprot:364589-Chlamydomonas_euryale.AAC.10